MSLLQKELRFDFCREEKGTTGSESRSALRRVHFEVFICEDHESHSSSCHFHLFSVRVWTKQRPIYDSSDERAEPSPSSHHSSTARTDTVIVDFSAAKHPAGPN